MGPVIPIRNWLCLIILVSHVRMIVKLVSLKMCVMFAREGFIWIVHWGSVCFVVIDVYLARS